MGLQKYRADVPAEQPYPNGARVWYTQWMGGSSMALIKDCPTMAGARTVYIRGEPDTFFSQPAACRVQGKDYHGYIMFDDDASGPRFYFRCRQD